MAFIKWMDELPFIAKLLISILLSVVYTVYMVIRDIKGGANIVAIVLDILFGTILGIVNWVVNIIFIIKQGKPVDYAVLFKL